MTFVRQKFKHCAVACIVSALEDKRLKDAQTNIVKKYPVELQAGQPNEGVPETTVDFEKIILSEGLGSAVHWFFDWKTEVYPLLLKNHTPIKAGIFAFLMTTHPTNHCVRILGVYPKKGLKVMNPEKGIEMWGWKKTETSKPSFCLVAP
jgi:hypothetical protein